MKPNAMRFAGLSAIALLLASAGCGGALAQERYVVSPPYTPAPEAMPNYELPQGTLYEFTMNSAESAIFPADIATGEPFDRPVMVYVPAQYEPGTPAPFIVVQDGVSYFAGTMLPVLDNMIAAGELPAMVAVFVEPGPNAGATEGQRSYEYDRLTEDYVNFVETELLPRVEAETGVTLTDDPNGRATMGGSSGGTAAFTMGWFRPDLYTRILTLSGSFTDLQQTADHPHGAWEYHEHLIAGSEPRPLRVSLWVGELDFDMNDDSNQRRNWVQANQAMADVLEAQGYAYRYEFAEGAEHVDYRVTEQTLPDTLRWLWQDYQP